MNENLVWLIECLNLQDAEEIGRALDAAEIPYHLNNQNMGALFPGALGGVSSFGLGKVVVMVREADLDDAQAIVRDVIG